MERVCEGCGERLRPDARPHAVFCSAACRSRQWRLRHRLRRRLAAVRSEDDLRSCPICGAGWVAGVDRSVRAVYCSKRCKVAAWRSRKETFGTRSQ